MSKKYAGENTIQEVITKTKALVGTKQDAITSTNKLDYSLIDNTPTIPTVNNATLTVQLNGNNVQTFTANQSTNATANIQALPNYSLSIGSTNGGNPRQVLFCSVNYTNFDSNSGAYFKLGAMSGHGNGSSYTFVEDIFINVNYQGTVTCQVYKYVQQAAGNVDDVARNYGDVFYTIDTTNKIVYFYILLGQYSSAQFTPGTKIGAAKAVTSANGIVQYTGTPTYYSSGTKVWASGNGATYMRTNDTLSGYLPLSAGSSYPLSGSLYSQDIFMYGGSKLWFGQSGLQHPSIGISGSSSERYIHFSAGNGTRCAEMHTYALQPGSDNVSLGYTTSSRWKDLWLSGSIKDGTNSVSVADINNFMKYTTTAPSAANTSGLKIALLDSEPSTKYDGWIYMIKES